MGPKTPSRSPAKRRPAAKKTAAPARKAAAKKTATKRRATQHSKTSTLKRKLTAADLDALKLSPEVAWYLESRGIPLPTCPPKFKTPEPRTRRGAAFDPERVDRVLATFRLMRHTQGRWAGQPLNPDPWQIAYIIAPVYGWVRWSTTSKDWVRIIRTEYVELPRKNGKTTLSGGQCMYMTAADGEFGAQVIAAAAGKDQAGFCFEPVRQIADKSIAMRNHVRVLAKKIVHGRTGSYFMAISSIGDLQHGANIHCANVDELHVHKTRDLVDAIETGTGARAQPLIIFITTADTARQATIYAEKRDYCERLARGVIKDHTFYGVIWAADIKDDPFAEATWKKANPGYGISPTKEYLQAEARKAKQSPANLSRFLRLHLGIRTKQETRYLELPLWDRNAGKVDETELHGRDCYGGLDLASSSDLTSLSWDFPDGKGGHDTIDRIWLPERAFEKLNERTNGEAAVWRRKGLLTVTPGEVTDYDYVRQAINEDRESFSVKAIGYDPWNATQLVNDLLGDEAPMVTVRQGFATMSSPTKELLRLLLTGTARKPVYRHGGNPAVRWQVDNFAVAMDAAGNVKPDKDSAADKIDSIVSRIIALSLSMDHKPARRSAYEDRDLEVV